MCFDKISIIKLLSIFDIQFGYCVITVMNNCHKWYGHIV
jgi:hypothetical protein